MAFSSSAIVLALALSAFAQEQPLAARPQSNRTPNDTASRPDTPPKSCDVTIPSSRPFAASFRLSRLGHPFDGDAWYGTEALWTAVPMNGVLHGPGPISSDFAYDNKMPWFSNLPNVSKLHGPLVITGRRLDGPAPAFTETFGDVGMVGIAIPRFGCWQVTGHYRDAELTFNVWVAQEQQADSAPPTPAAGSSSPATVPRRVYMDSDSQAKLLVYRVAPVIPEGIDAAAGTVLLDALISTDGRPKDLQYISGPPLLAQAAIDAVKWWQYATAMDGDESLEVETTIEVAFPSSAH
jgi:hypothetical protein